MSRWLRSLGPLGSFLANIIALLATNWGVVVSAVIGATTGIWALASDWVQNSRVQSAVIVFLVLFWTYIGFVVLRSQRKPTSVRVYHDYAYALAFEIANPLIDPDKPGFIMANFSFRNVGAGPAKCLMEDMRVILDGRTADHPITVSREFIVPRGTAKAYRSAAIPWDQTRTRLEGTADITLLYGHPDIGYERKLRLKFELGVGIQNGAPVALTAGIISEIDSPYKSL